MARLDVLLKPIAKQPKVIGADRLVAEVMHGEVGQRRDRLTVQTLKRDDRQAPGLPAPMDR